MSSLHSSLSLSPGLFTPNDVKQILQEVVKMQDFSHPHVMPLIGVCLDSGVGVVMPYMANGSVLSYLKNERGTLLLSEDAELEEVWQALSCKQNSQLFSFIVKIEFSNQKYT